LQADVLERRVREPMGTIRGIEVPDKRRRGHGRGSSGSHLVESDTTSRPPVATCQQVVRWRTRTYCVVVSLLMALLVGITRVYLGVHYLTDVLAG
jgi:hypothetical protein